MQSSCMHFTCITTPPADPAIEEMNSNDEDPNAYMAYLDDVSPFDQADHDLMMNSPVAPTLPEKHNITKRLFCSQPLPEAHHQQSDGLSQGTLNDVLQETIAKHPKKMASKKRKKHGVEESMSQPVEGSKLKLRRV